MNNITMMQARSIRHDFEHDGIVLLHNQESDRWHIEEPSVCGIEKSYATQDDAYQAAHVVVTQLMDEEDRRNKGWFNL